MIRRLSPEASLSLVIRHVDRAAISRRYRDERERVWQARLARAEALGKKLWNGELYTIETLEMRRGRLEIEMGSCEFKDVVFRIERGAESLEEEFGPEHVPRYVTADCIPTTADGKFVFGIRSSGTNVPGGRLGLIGGTLNKDEMAIDGFADIETFMRREIAEETTFDVESTTLRLYSINEFERKYEFLFTFALALESNAVGSMNTEAEFERLVALDLEHARVAEHGLDAFRFAKAYLGELTSLHGGQANSSEPGTASTRRILP
jgi:8-oxo-dGTP pyrophosphatase MutT (NUDIX family)